MGTTEIFFLSIRLSKNHIEHWKITLLSLILCSAVPVFAASPPALPLPPCQIVDGEEIGACLEADEEVSASAGGVFSEGATVVVTTEPNIGICDSHEGTFTLEWIPSPCYPSIQSPTVSTCGVIDIFDDNQFKEMSCSEALYDDQIEFTGSLFSVENDEGNRCGATGDFATYFRGGTLYQGEIEAWADVGNNFADCNIIFNGPRPNALLGPTWVKIRAGIGVAQTGDNRRAGSSAATELYVSIDGDLRQGKVDVGVLASISDQSYNDNTGVHRATIELVVENFGSDPAEDFDLSFKLPNQIHVEAVSDDRCLENGTTRSFVGAIVICRGLSLAEADDPLDRDIEFFTFDLRVTNSSELEGSINFEIDRLAEDENLSNNESLVRLGIDLIETGSLADTHALLDALEPFFNYEVSSDDLLSRQCNEYMDDIFDRLFALKSAQPGLFQNLSFGKVTSGDYLVFTGQELGEIDSTTLSAGNVDRFRAGHVGVVAYLKGTDYRRTGVVIHGTPTWSPTDLDDESKYGTEDFGDQRSPFGIIGTLGITGALNPLNQGTQDHGLYYRTPIQNFPGSARSESLGGCGFEGLYADNESEFFGNAPNCVVTNAGSTITGQSCNLSARSTILRTQSPIDIIATNADGNTIRTLGSEIYIDEDYLGRVFAWAEPHEDGSYAWLITLPDEGYKVELVGNDDGDYVFTHVTFDDESSATFEETRDTTSVGLVEELDVGDVSGFGTSSSSSSGGGGALDLYSLVAMLMALGAISMGRLFCKRSR